MRRETLRRGLVAAFVLLVVYSNLVVILNQSPLRTRLPRLRWTLDCFNLFGVFAYSEATNYEAFVHGRREGALPGQVPEWEVLDAQHFLPYRQAELRRQLAASRQANHEGDGGRRAQREIAAKIRALHNRENPARRVSSVQFGLVTWPRSVRGLNAARTRDRERYQVLFDEGP
jgi:hypothetical protein